MLMFKQVYYVDHGFSEVISKSKLFELHEKFYRLPFQATKCKLAGEICIQLWIHRQKIVSYLMSNIVFISICFRPGVIQSGADSTEEVWVHGHWQDPIGWDLRASGSASGGPVWHITRWWYQHQCCLYESSTRQILRESLKGNQKVFAITMKPSFPKNTVKLMCLKNAKLLTRYHVQKAWQYYHTTTVLVPIISVLLEICLANQICGLEL